MLRLKRAIEDCGIQQKAVVKATGFGKSQVSQTLSTGKLPANADKFRDGVCALVQQTPLLQEWLTVHRYNVERLFEPLESEPLPPVATPPDLATQIYILAGRASFDGGLSRGAALRALRALHLMSMVVPPVVQAEATLILSGGNHDHLSE